MRSRSHGRDRVLAHAYRGHRQRSGSVKPRRFKVQLDIRGVRWRSIQVEASFAEGSSGHHTGSLPAPSTGFFGIDRPDETVTIAMGYQIAQKLHA